MPSNQSLPTQCCVLRAVSYRSTSARGPSHLATLGRSSSLVVLVLALAFLSTGTLTASAQSLSRASVDSVSAFDLFKGPGTSGQPDASIDISSVIRLSSGWSVQVRPWFFKSSTYDSTWSKEIYQAAVRYQRTGDTSLRLDAGYIASPVGLGMTEMRADTNPTIQPHLSYFVPLLPFERGAPGVNAVTASYPLGATLTVSRTTWDARGALLASTPSRRYALSLVSRTHLTPTPTIVLGGGVTPRMGLRIGGSFVSGPYAAASEVADGANTHDLRMWTVEGEYAFDYTRVSGEFTRERFAHGASVDTAGTWFLQGVQTISPRWFAAVRHEAISAPPALFAGPGGPRLSFRTTERTIAYRLTPELTARTSITSQRFYTATTTDTRLGVQLVWSRRWW